MMIIDLVGIAAAIAIGWLARAYQERRRCGRMIAAATEIFNRDTASRVAPLPSPAPEPADLGRRAQPRHPVPRETADDVPRETADDELSLLLSAYEPHGLELAPVIREDHLLEITRRSIWLRWTRQRVLNRAMALGLTALDSETVS